MTSPMAAPDRGSCILLFFPAQELSGPRFSNAVTGFYDDVVPLTADEWVMIAQTDMSDEQFMQSTGVAAVWGVTAYPIHERISARPTLDIKDKARGEAALRVLVLEALRQRGIGLADPKRDK